MVGHKQCSTRSLIAPVWHMACKEAKKYMPSNLRCQALLKCYCSDRLIVLTLCCCNISSREIRESAFSARRTSKGVLSECAVSQLDEESFPKEKKHWMELQGIRHYHRKSRFSPVRNWVAHGGIKNSNSPILQIPTLRQTPERFGPSRMLQSYLPLPSQLRRYISPFDTSCFLVNDDLLVSRVIPAARMKMEPSIMSVPSSDDFI